MVYFGVKYTATAKGATTRSVKCVECRSTYSFDVAAKAKGRAEAAYTFSNWKAQLRARDRANENLAFALSQVVRLAACPNCGAYQPDMIHSLKVRRWAWLVAAGLIIFLMGLVFTALVSAQLPSARVEAILLSRPVVEVLLFGVAVVIGAFIDGALYKPNGPQARAARIGGPRTEQWPTNSARKLFAAIAVVMSVGYVGAIGLQSTSSGALILQKRWEKAELDRQKATADAAREKSREALERAIATGTTSDNQVNGVEILGELLGNTAIGLRSCIRKCKDESACVAYAFNADLNSCRTLSRADAVMTSSKHVSGKLR
jgi:hypothetical protein